jgi:hypothetical protein
VRHTVLFAFHLDAFSKYSHTFWLSDWPESEKNVIDALNLGDEIPLVA